MSKKMVEMANKDGDHQKVMPSAVKVWQRNGWTVVDDGSSETPAQTPEHTQRDQQQLSLLDNENKE